MKVELINISKTFGKLKVLDDIGFSFESGKPLGLLGRNGSGKTTTLRIIMDIFKSDTGKVLLDGNPIDNNKILIGYLPEVRGLFEKETIYRQLMYFARIKDVSKKDAQEQIDYYLKKFDLFNYKKSLLKTLSKGNQQKIQIIQALLGNPDIIVLDEPFSGLDPINAKFLKDVLIELTEQNKVIIFSSHQMNYIEEFCSDIVIIKEGKIKIKGNLDDIKSTKGKDTYILTTKSNIESLGFEYKLIGEDTYQVIIENTTLNDFIKRLVDNKVNILDVKAYKPSLFDVFVEEVGDDHE